MGNGTIAVVGSANMDLVVHCQTFPSPGQTVLGGPFATFPGGKGANQAVAAARLEGRVEFIGRLGSDGFGDELMNSLRAAGVKTDYVSRDPLVATGVASITVSHTGQNIIVVAPGSNMSLQPNEVCSALAAIEPEVVLAQLEIPLECVEACAGPHLFILNPAPARPLPETLYTRIDLITPNETEAEALTGVLPVDEQSCLLAAKVLLDRGVRQVVITLGERGSFWANHEAHATEPPFPVTPVDTTAAGDVFNGALAMSLAHGKDLPTAVQLANRAAALSTTRPGAQSSAPTLTELQALSERAH